MDSYTRAAINAPRLTARPSLGARLENIVLVSVAAGYAVYHYIDLARAGLMLFR